MSPTSASPEFIELLNHGYVRLVDSMGSDLSVSRSARVSYDADWRAGEDKGSDASLINYLMKNHHTSPFESVNFTFEISCPMFVARQWMRHRSWCLSGDTMVEFARPADGKPYYLSMKDMADRWNVGDRRQRNRKYRTMQQLNRDRIGGMLLRYRRSDGAMATTKILDVWESGRKEVFEVRVGDQAIKASADHKFLTDSGYFPVSELMGRKVCVRSRSGKTNASAVGMLPERGSEEWAEFLDGYEVSTHGRVRSYWGQGSRSKKITPVDKALAVNGGGRLVVSAKGKVLQVSRLVAEVFVPNPEGKPLVCHRDDNPFNNSVDNLYWGTHADNSQDSLRNGTRAVRGFSFSEVESVISLGEEPVYDLTVEAEEHNFVANGFVVHNCYNEISARYAVLPSEMYVPDEDKIGVQSADNKQMRDMGTADSDPVMAMYIHTAIEAHNRRCYALYEDLIEKKCPREVARGVLPTNIYTRFFATVDLHNLLHFIRLRDHSHAQYEIRVYAEALLELIRPIVPISVGAFEKHILSK